MSERQHQPAFLLLAVLAMIAWGGSWITARWAAGNAPEVTAFWRFLISAASFLPILWWRRESLALPRSAWPWVGLSALALGIYNLCFLGGLQTGHGGYGGVLVPSLNPLFAFLLSSLFLNHHVGRWTGLGLGLGFLGGMLQILGPGMETRAFLRPENLYFLGAALAYALLTLWSARSQRHISVFVHSFWVSLCCTALLLPFAWPKHPFALASLAPSFWINTVYLALLAGTFGTTVYFEAAKRVGGARASSFSFLVPVSALVLAYLFLGEVPQWTSLAGGALSIGAVMLVQLGQRPRVAKA
jgi:drug/metabolite transporter (DMT)-like permease